MGYKGSFLILDAPLSETPEEALEVLGFSKLRSSDSEFSIDEASREHVLGVTVFEGRTIVAGVEIADVAIGERGGEVRSLMARLGANRAVAVFLESVTDSFAYSIWEPDGSTTSRYGSRIDEEAEECGEPTLSEEEVRAMWAHLHPWEIEYLGTESPERDARGRPYSVDAEYGRLETWVWGEDFIMGLMERMLGARWDHDNEWSERPAQCFEESSRGEVPRATSRHHREASRSGALFWVAIVIGAAILTLRNCNKL